MEDLSLMKVLINFYYAVEQQMMQTELSILIKFDTNIVSAKSFGMVYVISIKI